MESYKFTLFTDSFGSTTPPLQNLHHPTRPRSCFLPLKRHRGSPQSNTSCTKAADNHGTWDEISEEQRAPHEDERTHPRYPDGPATNCRAATIYFIKSILPIISLLFLTTSFWCTESVESVQWKDSFKRFVTELFNAAVRSVFRSKISSVIRSLFRSVFQCQSTCSQGMNPWMNPWIRFTRSSSLLDCETTKFLSQWSKDSKTIRHLYFICCNSPPLLLRLLCRHCVHTLVLMCMQRLTSVLGR